MSICVCLYVSVCMDESSAHGGQQKRGWTHWTGVTDSRECRLCANLGPLEDHYALLPRESPRSPVFRPQLQGGSR